MLRMLDPDCTASCGCSRTISPKVRRAAWFTGATVGSTRTQVETAVRREGPPSAAVRTAGIDERRSSPVSCEQGIG
eukprot:7029330-Prymnesium_polylepis.1